MTEEQLAEIEARANAATPGPWTVLGRANDEADVDGPGDTEAERMLSGRRGMFARPEDAAFVAHARTDVPALVAEVRRLSRMLHPPYKPGDRVMVGHPRYAGPGLVDHVSPAVVAVQLCNGNVWEYGADTVRLWDPERDKDVLWTEAIAPEANHE